MVSFLVIFKKITMVSLSTGIRSVAGALLRQSLRIESPHLLFP